ncbi:DNA-3-methyladenine glycosylase family protein [Clostridium formicaceticum]|uniref:DNA-(apurinic or apyrimidinic site) lyase n=1 Tax=Clostridium formicaceticum TaxID=1497 RepID=A0AAC9WEW5_9CLOT|nr:DNA glycosylase [Clostridium formicaceticum]AOY75746.1 8-oxoguanine DNA glycosylase [Clostridium formicaceticum]ARE86069.1 DNA-3-methyladenine glycosylase [Clostridium formicaceticum]
MQLDILYKDNEVILKNMLDFDPKHIFECGQCFRWNKEEDGSYTGIAFKKVLNIKKSGGDIIFRYTNKDDFIKIWMNYFDLNTDYSEIKKKLSKNDAIMKEAINFGEGIRVLRQEPWETLVSFILSANNNIPRIKRSIELLCEGYGEYLGAFYGQKRYSFPDAKTIANLKAEEITACNTGYRAAYIAKTAAMVVDEPMALERIKAFDIEVCEKMLMHYPGVGPKVAQCVLFFCMSKMEAFPVDVWIKRVMEYFYFHQETTVEVIQQFAKKKYGRYAGFAQQYLFYYARELGLGKK